MMKVIATLTALAVGTTAANATTITIAAFDPGSYGAAASTFSSLGSENFESYSEGNVADGFTTGVGSFASLGGVGSGGTVSQADFANDGSLLAVRDGNVFGRVSTTQFLTGNASDDMFLDSNDTFGISWTASLGGALFDSILLTLTDAADVGARMVVSANNTQSSFEGAGNGNRQTVLISFAEAVSSARIDFENFRGNQNGINDGFSIDDISVGVVPLPASLAFMLAALGGLGLMRRRQLQVG